MSEGTSAKRRDAEALARLALSRKLINPAQFQKAMDAFDAQREEKPMAQLMIELQLITPSQATELVFQLENRKTTPAPKKSRRIERQQQAARPKKNVLLFAAIGGGILVAVVLGMVLLGGSKPASGPALTKPTAVISEIESLTQRGKIREAYQLVQKHSSSLGPDRDRLAAGIDSIAGQLWDEALRSSKALRRKAEFDKSADRLREFQAHVSGIAKFESMIETEIQAIADEKMEHEADARFATLDDLARTFERHEQWDRAISIMKSARGSSTDNPLLVKKIDERLQQLASKIPRPEPAPVVVEKPREEPKTKPDPMPEPERKPTPEPERPPKPVEPPPIVKDPSPVVPTPPPVEKSPEPELSALQRKVCDCFNLGTLTEWSVPGGKKTKLKKVDKRGIQTVFDFFAWTEITDAQLGQALMGSSKGPDLKDLAILLRENNLDSLAGKALYRYWQEAKPPASEIDRVLADWHKRSEPPEGGYTWNTKRERWEDKDSKPDPTAVTQIKKILEPMTPSSDLAKVEMIFGQAWEYYEKPEFNASTRDDMRDAMAAVLLDVRKAQITKLTKSASKSFAGKLPEVSKLLEEARRECLYVLLSEEKYPYKEAPNYGECLAAYQKLRAKVLRIWRGHWHTLVDPNLREAAARVERIDAMLTQKLELPPADSVDELLAVAAGKQDALAIRKYAATPAMKDLYAYNERVDKYNAGMYRSKILSGTGAPEDTIDHLNELNDWRESLGLKKLFMEPKLQKAAQKHSEVQAAAGDVWHNGSNGTPRSRCEAEGYAGDLAENVLIGQETGRGAVEAWDRSSGHARNQCDASWNCVGVGHSKTVWTQNFGNTTPPVNVGLK